MAGAVLNTTLQIRLDQFQNQLNSAADAAEQAARDISNKFTNINPSMPFLTDLASALSKGSLQGVVTALTSIITQFDTLQKAAAFASVSITDVYTAAQALRSGVGPVGEAFKSVASLLDRAKRGEDNPLAQIFKRNDIALNSIRDVNEAFEKLVDLIYRQTNEPRAAELGKKLGFDEDLVRNIYKVGDAFKAARSDAVATAPDLEKLADLARGFQEAWKLAVDAVVDYISKRFSGDDVLQAVNKIVKAWDFLQGNTGPGAQASATIGGLATAAGATSLPIERLTNDFFALAEQLGLVEPKANAVATAVNNVANAASKLTAALPTQADMSALFAPTAMGGAFHAANAPAFPPSRPTTQRNAAALDVSEAKEKERLNALDREHRRATERTAQLELEGKLIGKNVETRTRELEVLRLTQMADREKIKLTDQVRMKIDETAEAYAQAAGKQDELLRKHQQFVQLQTFAGNMIVDSIMQATEAGAKLSDVMANVAKQIARAALQALILGQGPLAGLFGTAPTTTGQVGGLLALLPKFQTGGIVPGSGPVPIMAHGGEMVLPAAAATRVAGGGQPMQFNQTIDARGAQAGVADQIAAALAANNRALQVTLPSMIRNAQGRGSLR